MLDNLKPVLDNLGSLVAAVSSAVAAATYLVGKTCEILAWLGKRRQVKADQAIEDAIGDTYVTVTQPIKKEAGELTQAQAQMAQSTAYEKAIENAAKVGLDLVKAAGGKNSLKGRIQNVFNRIKGKLTNVSTASAE